MQSPTSPPSPQRTAACNCRSRATPDSSDCAARSWAQGVLALPSRSRSAARLWNAPAHAALLHSVPDRRDARGLNSPPHPCESRTGVRHSTRRSRLRTPRPQPKSDCNSLGLNSRSKLKCNQSIHRSGQATRPFQLLHHLRLSALVSSSITLLRPIAFLVQWPEWFPHLSSWPPYCPF